MSQILRLPDTSPISPITMPATNQIGPKLSLLRAVFA